MLTGWDFPLSGKKAAEFDVICMALVVQFDFSLPRDLVLKVSNTEARRNELISMISGAIGNGRLEKHACLTLGGKLGFADSFLHGRLGSLLLKRLSEHAYGRSAKLDEELVHSLTAMVDRLKIGEARLVRAGAKQKWFVYTDASCEPETLTGGLGRVLLDYRKTRFVVWLGADC